MFGLYIHWPFCLSKCPYCDFNSHVRPQIDEDPWVKGILKEWYSYSQILEPKPITSIFFGGGTPSLVSGKAIGYILESIQKKWSFAPDIEITLEANPNSVETQKFKDFKEAGINRVSIGVQSLKDNDLQFLGRKHSSREACEAVAIAQKYFDRLSFDLIYARPDQNLKDWQKELKEALEFGLQHYSLYQLTLEKGTSFYQASLRGDFSLPDEELAREFYLLTEEIMARKSLFSYEVSNYASKGEEARHNLLYWCYGEFLGLGPGAHSRISLNKKRQAVLNIKSPELWSSKVEETGFGIKEKMELSENEKKVEFFLMGLRLKEGVYAKDFKNLFRDSWDNFFNMEEIFFLQEKGFLNYSNDSLCLTLEGRLCLNKIVDLIIN